MFKQGAINFTIKSYLNVFILEKDNQIPFDYKPEIIGGGKKEFTIKYNNDKYVFQRFHDDKNKLVLYSYEGIKHDCVILVIDKNKKSIVLTSFGKYDKCFKQETNIGSNLLRITLKMIEKYKGYFGIDKIVLSDNSDYKCKTGESIDMARMSILLTGHTWYGKCCSNNICPRYKDSINPCMYGKYGFRPIDKDDYTIDKVGMKIYNNNVKIMDTIKVSDIDLKKYLKKINKKYPDEFHKDDIKSIIKNVSKDKLLKTFLTQFFDKETFDDTCRYLKTFYKELFDDIGLKIPAHMYGKIL